MKITRQFTFEAAHHLTNYYGECECPHGHTYRLAVTVEGPVQQNGLVIDFAALKQIIHEKILSQVDHTDLNDLLPNPSAELIAIWIWKQLQNIGRDTKTAVELSKIQLWEGDNNSVIYEGN